MTPNLTVEGHIVNMDAFEADVRRLQSVPAGMNRILIQGWNEQLQNSFITGGMGTWIKSRSELWCPQAYRTLMGRIDGPNVIPTGIQNALTTLAASAAAGSDNTSAFIPLLNLMFGGQFIIERTTKCPRGFRIYKRGETVQVPPRPPVILEPISMMITEWIGRWLLDEYFMRGHRYFGRVHGIQIRPFSGVPTGKMMSGMTKTETRFYKTDYFQSASARRAKKIPVFSRVV